MALFTQIFGFFNFKFSFLYSAFLFNCIQRSLSLCIMATKTSENLLAKNRLFLPPLRTFTTKTTKRKEMKRMKSNLRQSLICLHIIIFSAAQFISCNFLCLLTSSEKLLKESDYNFCFRCNFIRSFSAEHSNQRH